MIGNDVGIVIIGRNEGIRLRRCLQSVTGFGARIYVDSGSIDGSQEYARSLGFTVLEVNDEEAFTAARARNVGIFHVAENYPHLSSVQTIDGDCEITPGWVEQACERLRHDNRLAVVFGRRRERFPARNIYHRACEIEWNVTAGPARSCGGDALFRLASLLQVGGFDPRLIAGEEPDLCFRLRQAGWNVFSDGRDMTLHDVDISSMQQWWRRAKRAGYAFTGLTVKHGFGADQGWSRLLLSGFFWSGFMLLGVVLLFVSLLLGSLTTALTGLVLAVVLALQLARTAARTRPSLPSWAEAMRWSGLLLVSKLAQVQGSLLYLKRRLTAARTAIIEYK